MQQHWERVYSTKEPEQVSWFQPHLEISLDLIGQATRGDKANASIDVGGGASTLVDDLIARGYRDLTVLDLSETALEVARKRLGPLAGPVQWLQGDVTRMKFPLHAFDVWHDRAVFHFLTQPEERRAYVRNVASVVKPGGHVIVGTFGPEGPAQCSGLDVMRYEADSLHDEFGSRFQLVKSAKELHKTPFGTTQQFLYCYCILDSGRDR
jgi:SAM-dependent methyltransferase